MRSSVIRATVACVAVVFLLSACSESNPEAAFNLKVELKYANPACDRDPHCWLPTQFHSQLASGESVSLNTWPAKGDTVRVVCQTTGQSIRDYTGRASDKWFGIVVPADKLASSPTKAKPIKGGYLGYVSAVWMASTTNSAPKC
jgi:hypothetical protein